MEPQKFEKFEDEPQKFEEEHNTDLVADILLDKDAARDNSGHIVNMMTEEDFHAAMEMKN